jgi:hypothetical protein
MEQTIGVLCGAQVVHLPADLEETSTERAVGGRRRARHTAGSLPTTLERASTAVLPFEMPARVGQVSVPTPRSQDKGHGAARMAMGMPPTIQLAPFSQSIVAPFAAFKLDTPRSARSSRAPGEGVSPRLSPRASRPSTAASRPGTSSSARSSNRLLEHGQKHLFSPSQQHSRFSGGAGRQVISPFATFRDLMPPPISIAVSSGDAVENDLMPPVHEQPSSPRAGQLRQATYSSEPTGPCLSFFQQLGPLRRPVPSADAANSAGTQTNKRRKRARGGAPGLHELTFCYPLKFC